MTFVGLIYACCVVVNLLSFSNCYIARPNIGILSQPTKCAGNLPVDDKHYSYINSDYVKWLEMSGARIIPIMYDWKKEKMRFFFERINGILLPGGDCTLDYKTSFVKAEKLFFDWALNETEYFPIWGTCQGFESLFILRAETDEVLDRNISASEINLALDLNRNLTSRIFQNVSESVLGLLLSQAITFNWHSWGITPETFSSTPSLNDFFDIVSTNYDLLGNKFISTVQAKDYPIYGAQWHAEMVLYADLPPEIRHSYDAVVANSVTSTFFVEECRKSTHTFPSDEYSDDYTIENFDPVFTGKRGKNTIRQSYYFANQNPLPVPPHHNTTNNDERLEYEYIIIGASCGAICMGCMCSVVLVVCCFDKCIKCIKRQKKKRKRKRELFDAHQQEQQAGDQDEDSDLLHPYYAGGEEEDNFLFSTGGVGGGGDDFLGSNVQIHQKKKESSSSLFGTSSSSVGNGRQLVSSDGLKNQSGVSYQTETIVNSLFE